MNMKLERMKGVDWMDFYHEMRSVYRSDEELKKFVPFNTWLNLYILRILKEKREE